jgi:hypothetical protein
VVIIWLFSPPTVHEPSRHGVVMLGTCVQMTTEFGKKVRTESEVANRRPYCIDVFVHD